MKLVPLEIRPKQFNITFNEEGKVSWENNGFNTMEILWGIENLKMMLLSGEMENE